MATTIKNRICAFASAFVLSVALAVPAFNVSAVASEGAAIDWALIAADAGYEILDTQMELFDNYCDDLYALYLGATKNGKVAEALVAAWLRTGAFTFEQTAQGMPVMNGILKAGNLVKEKMEDGSFSPFQLETADGSVDEDVTSSDVSEVSGDVFNDAVTSINNANYYIPEVTSDRKILSFQTQPYDSFRKINYSSFSLPLRYSSDLFLGLDWSEVYLCPFITDDDNVDGTYYGLYQFRLYHEVTEDNIVQIYMDVIPFIDESQAAEHILVCGDVAAYPYIIISPYFYEPQRVFNLDGNATLQDFIQFQKHRNYICYKNSTYSQLMSTQSNMFAAGHSLLAASTMQLLSNTADDAGYICQQTPFVIDYSPIPDAVTQIPTNYYITINGDNIYDYGVTDPDTNETTTINYYITNNNFPSEDGGDDSGSGGSSGSVGGDVTVSGNIDVGGSVDININVNDNSGTGDSGSGEDIPSYIDENFNVLDYLKMLPTLSDGFKEYISGVFDWLPADLLALIIGGVAVAIFCRLAGR